MKNKTKMSKAALAKRKHKMVSNAADKAMSGVGGMYSR